MPTHPHYLTHIEISAHDHKEAANFYSAVFGWQMREFPEMNYSTFTAEGGTGGGFNPVSEDNPAGTILVYIHTDDLKASLAKIEANGGKVLMRNFEIPTVGWMATFQDPTGNTLALLKPLPME